MAPVAARPALVSAVLHHLPALEVLFRDRMALQVKIARFYNARTGVVTLKLTCDPQTERLFRDEARATFAARDALISAGFYVDVMKACELRLTGYYGRRIPEAA